MVIHELKKSAVRSNDKIGAVDNIIRDCDRIKELDKEIRKLDLYIRSCKSIRNVKVDLLDSSISIPNSKEFYNIIEKELSLYKNEYKNLYKKISKSLNYEITD